MQLQRVRLNNDNNNYSCNDDGHKQYHQKQTSSSSNMINTMLFSVILYMIHFKQVSGEVQLKTCP
jgi:hypothetical protein